MNKTYAKPVKTSSFWEIYGSTIKTTTLTLFCIVFFAACIAGEIVMLSGQLYFPGAQACVACAYIGIFLACMAFAVAIIMSTIYIVKYVKTWRHIFYLPLSSEDLRAERINNLAEYMAYLRDKLSFTFFRSDRIEFVSLPCDISLKIENSINENFDSSNLFTPVWRLKTYSGEKEPLIYSNHNDCRNIATYIFYEGSPSVLQTAPKLK